MAILLFKWLLLSLLTGSGYDQNPANQHSTNHPFYISVTEINHNAADKNLEISCKIFTDDFESALTKAAGTKVDLFNPKDKAAVDKHITTYIRKHLVVKIDGKPAVLEFIGFEREEEAVWSYLQVSNTVTPKRIEVMNDLLYDSFNQQINLMHVAVGGNRKSTKLNYPDTNASFQF